jgi:putative salt-induced outer membrane protein YdiY
MLPKHFGAAATAVLLALLVNPAVADEIRMKNGDVLTGQILKKETDRVILKTTYAGEVPIQWSEVANVITDQPLHVVLSDGTSLHGTMVESEPGSAKMEFVKVQDELSDNDYRAEELPEASFDLVSAKYLNPTPDLTGEGMRWSGNINAGASLSNGNNETKQIRFDAETIARALRQRYTLGGQFNRAEDRGEDTLFNSRVNGKYDYFFSKKWYGYANSTLENDRFRDLRLRSTVGAGTGYQIFETPNRNLSLEAGLNYVSEDYYEAEDDSYPGVRWATRYDELFFSGKTKFFHEHEVLVGLKEVSQVLVYSKTGFRFPLVFDFNASAQFNFNWDSTPAEGREKEDSTLLFTLGYGW